MSWEFLKFRIRKRAERTVLAVSSYIHSNDEEENPEENLEKYLRQKARLKEYEEGIL